MITDPYNSTIPPLSAAGEEDLSNQITEILNQQIVLARSGKLDEVMTLIGKIDQLISQYNPQQLKNIWAKDSIRSLHDELRLIIEAIKSEVSKEVDGIRKGKTSLRAYKSFSG
ncbi:MAG: hypothetical protein GY794_13835 [bacterium]|nr:hypothetical protein [bacterium]